MRLGARTILSGMAIMALAIPMWARPSETRTDRTTWNPDHETKIGTMEFAPGNYELAARESGNQVDVVKDGKVVAQVPCQWIALPKKAINTEVLMNNDQVVQLEFAGRPEAVQFH